jgi:hypothetical protein
MMTFSLEAVAAGGTSGAALVLLAMLAKRRAMSLKRHPALVALSVTVAIGLANLAGMGMARLLGNSLASAPRPAREYVWLTLVGAAGALGLTWVASRWVNR